MPSPRDVVAALAATAALAVLTAQAQTRPKLADYYTTLPLTVLDAGYAPRTIGSMWNADLDSDGDQDLVVVGGDYPSDRVTSETFTTQPGRVFLGDGDGHFVPAPTDRFPIDTLNFVTARQLFFADFNGDGHPDMFVACQGWDAPPYPGEQNRLYLSLPDGGWRDETASLPQISDFSHSSSIGDISGRGLMDIFIGNQGRLNLSYTLLNTGSGRFTQSRAGIPADRNQLLDHNFSGSTLADLDGDGLPELIVMRDNSWDRQQTTILWNRQGIFRENDQTELPPPAMFTKTHIDLDAEPIDVNQDGLLDLVLVGTQGQPAFYNGSFVQILVNHGDRRFVDETATRIAEGESSRGIDGVRVDTAPYAKWVRVLDFDHDGAPDFSMEFSEGRPPDVDQPIIWLNDGTGHFTVLKVRDFVAAGSEFTLSTTAHLVPTRNGYSFIKLLNVNGGLSARVLLAVKPYHATTARAVSRKPE